mmetsp:Transcript_15819/g.33208  ORF Transcript_15819/g.33208 Transcript_15819/m.33208 type:complete len:176 (-) Transcript_15819:645-1172(-)|eukprot:CAMPEP_0171332800 /NCGR_PEP_ID=MMETSP0878-20121228/3609_1 /TAXON_ID=67004 /ORGANISM="Thalassiosira weissflogii, Strain CCMP1336" /LENGTH=175 /DNA_ID=CAMNT_0011833631 /DNA_START=38 /DNA_END=565 /DNA_ORIENTATION=+
MKIQAWLINFLIINSSLPPCSGFSTGGSSGSEMRHSRNVLSPVSPIITHTAKSMPPRDNTTTKEPNLEDYIKSEISSHDVVIFSTTYCPHCGETKKLFKNMNVDARVIELDLMKNGLTDNGIAEKLHELTGQRTVPNVFIKGMYLGGNQLTQEIAKTGSLHRTLGLEFDASELPL